MYIRVYIMYIFVLYTYNDHSDRVNSRQFHYVAVSTILFLYV